jgi:hypothetical protein
MKSSSLEKASTTGDEEAPQGKDKDGSSTETAKAGEKRMIIYTAHMNIAVRDSDSAIKTLTDNSLPAAQVIEEQNNEADAARNYAPRFIP